MILFNLQYKFIEINKLLIRIMSDKKKTKNIYNIPILIISTNYFLIDNFIENYFFFAEQIPTVLNKKKHQFDETLSRIVEINKDNYLINFKASTGLSTQELSLIIKNISILFFLLDVSDHTCFESLINDYVSFMVNEHKLNFKGPIFILGICDKGEVEGIETEKDEVECYLELIDNKNIKYIDLTSMSSDTRFITINKEIQSLIEKRLINLSHLSGESCLVF